MVLKEGLDIMNASNCPKSDVQMGQDIIFDVPALDTGITVTFPLRTSE